MELLAISLLIFSIMDRQLYFLLDSVSECRRLVLILDKKRLRYSFLNVLASAGTDTQGLRSISVTRAAERARKILIGLIGGTVAGVLGGILAISTGPVGDVLLPDSQMLLMTAGAGALLGLLISPIIGLRQRSRNVEQFQTAVNSGQVLLMLEMPRTDIYKAIELVERHFSAAEVALVRS